MDKINRVPYDLKNNYSKEIIEHRLDWISKLTGKKYTSITHYPGNPEDCRGNTENFIGMVQVPMGLMGPLQLHGGPLTCSGISHMSLLKDKKL